MSQLDGVPVIYCDRMICMEQSEETVRMLMAEVRRNGLSTVVELVIPHGAFQAMRQQVAAALDRRKAS
jgi:hypothetical protein